MAIGTPTYNGKTSTNSGGTTFAATPSTAIPADNYVFLIVARDNATSTSGDNSEVSGVTDAQGNTWTKLREMTYGQGAANAGAMISVWGCRPSGTYGTTTATVSFTSAQPALAVFFVAVPVASGATLQLDASTSYAGTTSGFGTLSLSGLSPGTRVFLSAAAKETNSTTAITPTSGFTSAGIADYTGPGILSPQQKISWRAEWKVGTDTSITSAPTWADTNDTASVFLALSELLPTKTLTADNLSLSYTYGSGGAVQTHVLAGAGLTEATGFSTGAALQVYALAGDGLSLPRTYGSGPVTQPTFLYASGLSLASSYNEGAIAQTPALQAATLVEALAFTSDAIGQTHILGAAGASLASSYGAGPVTQPTILAASNPSLTSTYGAGGITQTQALAAAGLSFTDGFGSGAVGQTHVLAGNTATEALGFGTGAVVQTQTLGAAGLTEATNVSTGGVQQTFVLGSPGASFARTLSVGVLVFPNALGAGGLAFQLAFSPGNIAQKQNLTAAGLTLTKNFASRAIYFSGQEYFLAADALSTTPTYSSGPMTPLPRCDGSPIVNMTHASTIWDDGGTTWDSLWDYGMADAFNTVTDLGLAPCDGAAVGVLDGTLPTSIEQLRNLP